MISIHVERDQGLFIASAAEPQQALSFGFGLSEDEAISDLLATMALREAAPLEASQPRRGLARA